MTELGNVIDHDDCTSCQLGFNYLQNVEGKRRPAIKEQKIDRPIEVAQCLMRVALTDLCTVGELDRGHAERSAEFDGAARAFRAGEQVEQFALRGTDRQQLVVEQTNTLRREDRSSEHHARPSGQIVEKQGAQLALRLRMQWIDDGPRGRIKQGCWRSIGHRLRDHAIDGDMPPVTQMRQPMAESRHVCTWRTTTVRLLSKCRAGFMMRTGFRPPNLAYLDRSLAQRRKLGQRGLSTMAIIGSSRPRA